MGFQRDFVFVHGIYGDFIVISQGSNGFIGLLMGFNVIFPDMLLDFTGFMVIY